MLLHILKTELFEELCKCEQWSNTNLTEQEHFILLICSADAPNATIFENLTPIIPILDELTDQVEDDVFNFIAIAKFYFFAYKLEQYLSRPLNELERESVAEFQNHINISFFD
jgi:hypothetical protein